MKAWPMILALAASCGHHDGPSIQEAGVDAAIAPLHIVALAAQVVDEEQTLTLAIATEGGVATPRIFVTDLPPGAQFDEPTRTLTFTPDFTQGGATWVAKVTADDGTTRADATVEITALDTIRPPAPTVTAMQPFAGYTQLTVTQVTDAFLDSPTRAGRTFTALVTIPTNQSAALPVRIVLHGFGGTPPTAGSTGEYRINPHDPDNTYWWGYGDSTPVTSGAVRDYTQRRVLHLLAWLLATYPQADADRVQLEGTSMGGAGVMELGLLHARHFAHVRSFFGQAIPRNHRPSRIAQLQTLWGTPALDLDDGRGMGAWTRQDLTRVLRDEPAARDQFLTVKHSKDDPTIHFGAVTFKSPLTQLTFYGALQTHHVGHFAIWDEGGHGDLDPVLGNAWWTAGWDPIFDTTALLRRDRAFPAFTHASIDRDPGTGAGNGTRAFDVETGYAATISVAGDTGWDGERAGAINRFLRWDAATLVDTVDRFELPLRVIDGPGSAPTREGDPTRGDKLDGVVPVTVDVTPRRVQAFRTMPDERIAWTFGAQTGTVTADATGAVTVPQLALTTAWTALILTRAAR